MKYIKDYEGLYIITENGNIFSYKSNKFLKHTLNKGGYHMVDLYNNGKRKRFLIHRLVAEAFIPNPNNLPCVNHKDENKSNNNVNNLEWCSYEYNNNYGTRVKRSAEKRSKAVYCIELNRTFKSQTDAAKELGISQGNISSCLTGKIKTTGGYHFKFADIKEIEGE